MNTLLLAAALLAQGDAARATEILRAASDALKDATALRLQKTMITEGYEGKNEIELAVRRPNLVRMTLKPDDLLDVLDGKTCWSYVKESNEYMKYPQEEAAAGRYLGPLGAIFLKRDGPSLLADAKDVSVKREKIGDAECDVIRWTEKKGQVAVEWALWFDAKRQLRRSVEKAAGEDLNFRQTVDIASLEADPRLPDDAFTFVPPKDAKEARPGEDLDKSLLAEGAAAPDFKAADVDGKEVTLSSFKGKTVLLNFWFYN